MNLQLAFDIFHLDKNKACEYLGYYYIGDIVEQEKSVRVVYLLLHAHKFSLPGYEFWHVP